MVGVDIHIHIFSIWNSKMPPQKYSNKLAVESLSLKGKFVRFPAEAFICILKDKRGLWVDA